ncbi:MAG: hypothetical protein M3Q67_08985 [Actinomycetota bacterium]|nr:hypothetical protein [Actinomycetota bacterium]
MSPNLRELPLRRILETVEDGARDRELEDAVSEELEALVRLGAVLGPGRVREYLLEPVFRKLVDQTPELGRPSYLVRATPGVR